MKALKLLAVVALAAALQLQVPREVCGDGGCCRDFEIFCQGICWEHQGVLLTNCSCTLGFEHCVCYESYVYAGPNWYCDCLEG